MADKREFDPTPNSATRRLTSVRPREVSVVDTGANGRKFLLIKSKDGILMKKNEIFKNEVSEKEPKTENAAESSEGKKEVEAKDVVVEKLFQDQVAKDLDGISIMKALASEQKDMFLAMSEALFMFAKSADMIRADLMAFTNSDGETSLSANESVSKGLEDGVSDAVFDSLVCIVEKKGRKMKAARLEKLRSILSSLGVLVQDLDNDSNKDYGSENVKKEETKTETTENVVKSEEASEKQPEEKAPEAPAADEAKAPSVDEAVEKALKPLLDRIEKLESAPAKPSSVEADTTEETVTKAESDSIFKGVLG